MSKKLPPTVKICKRCGAEFTSTNDVQVFCSYKCANKFHQKKSRINRRTPTNRPLTATCKVCGTLIPTKRSYCNDCFIQKRRMRANIDRYGLRQKILKGLGNECACCKIAEPQAILCVDHINNDGHSHRLLLNKSNHGMYLEIVRLNFPKDRFQLLCYNCNVSKALYGDCAHNNFNTGVFKYVKHTINDWPRSEELKKYKLENHICFTCNNPMTGTRLCENCSRVYAARSHWARYKLRRQILDAYGNKCQQCGESHWQFLAIDHINDDGRTQRRAIKQSQFYGWLKKNNYPKEEYQILCYNCNYLKQFKNANYYKEFNI